MILEIVVDNNYNVGTQNRKDMITQSRKFNKSNYVYNLVNWDKKSCIDKDCNNVVTNDKQNIYDKDVLFCSKKCVYKRYEIKNLPEYYYQNRCLNCSIYMITKHYQIYCNDKCRQNHKNKIKRLQNPLPIITKKCEQRYCYKIISTIDKRKKFCSKSCTKSESWYRHSLRHNYHSYAPRYIYVMYNKKYDCYKYGIASHKSRINKHKKYGFDLIDKRFYPKNALFIEQHFKKYLYEKGVKPALNKEILEDGWTETISAKDIKNLNINIIKDIYDKRKVRI